MMSEWLRSRAETAPPDGYHRQGRILRVSSTLLNAWLPEVFMGELCRIQPGGALAEVVSINGGEALLSPFASTTGLHCGQSVIPLGRRHQIPVGESLLGRVIDGFGQPLEGDPLLAVSWRDVDSMPPPALSRRPVDQPLMTGIRAIDSTLTCGAGQRMGIFSAPGVGKSTLLAMLCNAPDTDINVLVLIGERGREVGDFLNVSLAAQARQRSVIVVATADRPALERMRALSVATTIAEAFRDSGKHVLLLVDSLTRYARAAREISLAAGEPPVAGTFPARVFSTLPNILERAGRTEKGSITAFYSVLVERDDMNEPLADEVRSLLDGHIVLSRQLAERGHFPAIDVLASLSRVMPDVVSDEHCMLASTLRQYLATYQEVELLVRIGEYQRGQDVAADRAIDAHPAICTFFQQKKEDLCHTEMLLEKMRKFIAT
ncbi:EscN/YscN/HrcN family type III secretion system ATPase [Kosakonia sp. CCTCC M2018092]|uniref:EscN/YscN/HrcN family type III secretion system ATPase n=1 Tax=Kosakonia sp. CCTCC M2018092 TaxID=2492396 RepID=UPI000F61185B|nr:EscN/YscN/HrcN family type III secretion system ATPase [Kosakonia sp. CCTCC M2018092]AZI89605.1 EscN/YscN/HrcN family type III secretion system ATPase [Kosakonia sp. CCTCC M2018092]